MIIAVFSKSCYRDDLQRVHHEEGKGFQGVHAH
jgi:hypothetical protein